MKTRKNWHWKEKDPRVLSFSPIHYHYHCRCSCQHPLYQLGPQSITDPSHELIGYLVIVKSLLSRKLDLTKLAADPFLVDSNDRSFAAENKKEEVTFEESCWTWSWSAVSKIRSQAQFWCDDILRVSNLCDLIDNKWANQRGNRVYKSLWGEVRIKNLLVLQHRYKELDT